MKMRLNEILVSLKKNRFEAFEIAAIVIALLAMLSVNYLFAGGLF